MKASVAVREATRGAGESLMNRRVDLLRVAAPQTESRLVTISNFMAALAASVNPGSWRWSIILE